MADRAERRERRPGPAATWPFVGAALSAAFWEAAFVWLLVFLLRVQPARLSSPRGAAAAAAGARDDG